MRKRHLLSRQGKVEVSSMLPEIDVLVLLAPVNKLIGKPNKIWDINEWYVNISGMSIGVKPSGSTTPASSTATAGMFACTAQTNLCETCMASGWRPQVQLRRWWGTAAPVADFVGGRFRCHHLVHRRQRSTETPNYP